MEREQKMGRKNFALRPILIVHKFILSNINLVGQINILNGI